MTNTDPVRALIAPKLDMIISGYRINQDDADWLRGLLHRASATQSAPVGVEVGLLRWVKAQADDPDANPRFRELYSALSQQPAAPHWGNVPELDDEQLAADAERAFFAQDFYEEARKGKKPWPAAPSREAVGDWVLVPRTPTLDMANAAWRELESQGIDPEDVEAQQVWDAMLAAAPQQPAGVDEATLHAAIVKEAAEVLQMVADSGVTLPPNWRWPLLDELSGIAYRLAAQQQGGRDDG